MTEDEKAFDNLRKYFAYSIYAKPTVENGVVSCTDSIRLKFQSELEKLPVEFFSIDVGFDVSNSKLKSLEGCPKIVDGYFKAERTNITNLKGAPVTVNASFTCSNNSQLISLEGAPKYVGGNFSCDHTNIRNFRGVNMVVDGNFRCINTSIEEFNAEYLSIKKKLYLTYHEDIHLLGILKIKDLQNVTFIALDSDTDTSYDIEHTELTEILHKYLHTGTRGMLSCAIEMIKAGYGSNAKP